ncbi:uncharacterized protein RCC_04441 [Ramularia collo-cygni]|uniref:Uncharacterized protein n=1 Tax=Ramularia collo-cygni TaxID=112498 RepID=A0A2D3V1Q2_9PEZI|nr:uncharacterized protein RCC_04441 [Ramularia collo-cygni]CZT18597.1 uncharacterized protein RCC_04441 [Ramularia collo-cygni]
MSDFGSSPGGGEYRDRANRRDSDRNSNATDTSNTSNTPSLVHSPSSSYGTVASNHSYRPLAPRHNPFTTTNYRKSLELVAFDGAPPSPTQMLKDSSMKSSASTMTSFRVAEASDLSYENRRKSSSNKYDQIVDNGLKEQRFSHDAVRTSSKTR